MLYGNIVMVKSCCKFIDNTTNSQIQILTMTVRTSYCICYVIVLTSRNVLKCKSKILMIFSSKTLGAIYILDKLFSVMHTATVLQCVNSRGLNQFL